MGETARFVIYEPPQTGPYKAAALVAVLLAAFVIGSLASAVTAGRC
jgi:hypothetical protein